MKSILLTTTAIVAFAGAAAADGHAGISFTGDATLGYNDDVENGFYWDSGLDITMTAALDNGLTATADFSIDLAEDDSANGNGSDLEAGDFVLKLASDTASLTFGDVDPVAEDNYGGVDGDSTTGFNDQDAHFTVVGFDAMLVGEVSVNDITAMVSWGVFENETGNGELDALDALQVYATGDFGMFSVEAAFQDELTGLAEYTVFAVSATASVAGAEVTGAFITNSEDDAAGVEEQSSIGLAVSYPVGPVTAGGYYSFNDDDDDAYGVSVDYADGPIAVNVFHDFSGGENDVDDDSFEAGIEGSYDTGLGLTMLAGYIVSDSEPFGADNEEFYVAGEYDLGGGANLLVSYAENEANDTDDEIGDPEYNHGATVELSFSF